MTKTEATEMKKNLKEVYRYLKETGAPTDILTKQYSAIIDLAFENFSENK